MTHEPLAICKDRWERVEKHLNESQGVRDRLRDAELKIQLIEKQVLRNAILGGIIGALIGSGASPAIIQLVNFILRVG